jgi:hypothetical protein
MGNTRAGCCELNGALADLFINSTISNSKHNPMANKKNSSVKIKSVAINRCLELAKNKERS